MLTQAEKIRLVVCLGMGVDSVAVSLRLIHEPEILAALGLTLRDVVFITSMVGDEFDSTRQHMVEHILPLFRAHGVRYVQVARREHSMRGNCAVVLSDSDCPSELHFQGSYKLSQEYLHNASGPELGKRKCSMKNKGEVIDNWLRLNLPQGVEFLHAIGYAKGEESRAAKDDMFAGAVKRGPVRKPWHPLIDWGWDRAKCYEYIREKTGVAAWPKSCCVFCPFAGPRSNAELNADHLAYLGRLASSPSEAAHALLVEYNNMSFNHRQALYAANGTLADALRAHGGAEAAFAAFEERLDALPWALYRVRRVQGLTEAQDNISNDRSIELIVTGSQASMAAKLATQGDVSHEGGIAKVFTSRRRIELSSVHSKGGVKAKARKVAEVLTNGPVIEEFYVAAPRLAASKTEAQFEAKWDVAVNTLVRKKVA
jgi:hypothetical protein